MQITKISQSRHRLSIDPPFAPTWDSRPRHSADLDLVRIETDTGHVGYAAGTPMPGFRGHEDLFIGHNPLDLARHNRVIENLSFHYGRCWPLDVALWDLAGKITGQPIWRLLGGASGGRVPCYASMGVRRDAKATVAHAEKIAEAGFPAIKLRFQHDDWRDDLAVVEAVRAAVGGNVELMVDCNQAWRMPWDTQDSWTLKEAISCARDLEELGIYWMEEPLHRGDFSGMAELRQSSDMRIAAGEMARERHDAQQLIDRGCVDVLQTDALFCGGITGLSHVFRAALDRGRQISPHTWGHGLGLLANAHLAVGIGGCPFLEVPFDPPEWGPERRDFGLRKQIQLTADGYLTLGETPGLGVEFDDAVLKRTRVDLD